MLARTVSGVLFCIAIFGVTVTPASAQICEDFENYTPGTFPWPSWQDVANWPGDPPGGPVPSMLVVDDSFGTSSNQQSVETVDAIYETQGIYQLIEPNARHRATADVFIRRYAEGQFPDPSYAWPIGIGFAHLDDSLPFSWMSQVQLYAGADQHWRMFVNVFESGSFQDIDLCVPANTGIWYRIELTIDAPNGQARIRIWNRDTDELLDDSFHSVSSLAHDENYFQALIVTEGELGNASRANLSVVDNVILEDTLCYSTAQCPEADVNCDNVASGLDIAAVQSSANFGLSKCDAQNPRADVNGDGVVSGLDVAAISSSACFGH